MSMPAHRTVPAKKPLNPHPRHEHVEWHTPREGLAKARHQGVAVSQVRPRAKKR